MISAELKTFKLKTFIPNKNYKLSKCYFEVVN